MLRLSCSSWQIPNPGIESMTPVSDLASCSSARRVDFALRLGPRHPAVGSMSSMPGSSVSRSIRSPTRSGLCRTLLAGIDGPGLELNDALERPLPRNRSAGGFDRILATPAMGWTDGARFIGPVPVPEPQFGDFVSSARDGESFVPGEEPLLRCRKDHCSDSAPTGR